MKKLTKKLAIVALSATLAVSAGAALGMVAYSQESITASAAQGVTVDLSKTVKMEHWNFKGEFSGLYMFRFWLDDAKALSWDRLNFTKGSEYENTLMQAVKVNGKTVKEWKDAYKAGQTNPITWDGEITDPQDPNYKDQAKNNVGYQKGMLDRIFVLTHNNEDYAPVDITLCNHGTSGCSIDIYVPVSMIPLVNTIEFTKDFSYESQNQVFTFGEKGIVFEGTSFGYTGSYVGEKATYETVETTVVKGRQYYGEGGALMFFLENHDYPTSVGDYVLSDAERENLKHINYYDYIELDGVKLGTAMGGQQGQAFINVWGNKNSFATRWPFSWTDAQRNGVQTIKILKGCQFMSYADKTGKVFEVKEDVTLVRDADGYFVNVKYLLDKNNVTISKATEFGEANELYKIDISNANWNMVSGAGGTIDDPYVFNRNQCADVRKNILINGVSLYDINAKTDDSSYQYSTFPWTHEDTATFQHPTLVTGEDKTLSVYVHKSYVESLNASCIEVTIKKGFDNYANPNYFAKEDIKAIVLAQPVSVNVNLGKESYEVKGLYGDNFDVATLDAPTATGKTFEGWADAEGNLITEAFTLTESTTIYAKWTVTVYTLTIVNGEETKTITFGVENDGTLDTTASELAGLLTQELPAEDEYFTYTWAEDVPETFELQNYTFTVTKSERRYTVSVITGNPQANPECVTKTEHSYNDTFKVSELVAPTAEGKTFAGWTDVEGNAIAADFAITENTAIYASWTVTVYTLTIVNGEETKTITFGVENDGTVDATVGELAELLSQELPAENDNYTYAWTEALPETFELKDYTFTVKATEKAVEVPGDNTSDTTSEEEKPAKSGCGSAIGSTLALTGIALAASALIIKKRKED